MKSKSKCPVCNVPLTECGDLLSCPNDHCAWVGNAELWNALIQAKQDLEIARNALEEARINLDAIQPYLGDEYILSCKQDGLKAIDDTLEQIKHKE